MTNFKNTDFTAIRPEGLDARTLHAQWGVEEDYDVWIGAFLRERAALLGAHVRTSHTLSEAAVELLMGWQMSMDIEVEQVGDAMDRLKKRHEEIAE